MRRIESPQNELIKRFKKLSQKKYRGEERLFLIEGKNSVFDSLNLLSFEEIDSILSSDAEAERIAELFPFLEEKIIVTSKNALTKISDYVSASDVIVVAKQRQFSDRISSKLCLFLDRIREPGNLGTILRTAAAAGFGVLLSDCCDVYNPKVVRSSMSAIASVNIAYASKDTLNELKSEGYTVLGAKMDGENIFDFSHGYVTAPLVIAIGNESQGLSQSILSSCDKTVSIPIEGIESLNASIAASILMFEVKHRLI